MRRNQNRWNPPVVQRLLTFPHTITYNDSRVISCAFKYTLPFNARAWHGCDAQ